MEPSLGADLSTFMCNVLLNASDGDPVRKNRFPVTQSPFLLVGDHAGRAIPASLNGLGLSSVDRSRHIALDLGVKDLGMALGNQLGAPFLWQHFSRLVCDCNRDPRDSGWAPQLSDGTTVPGNQGLNREEIRIRRKGIFDPYQVAIAAAIERRQAGAEMTILVSLHSFTPTMAGSSRPWDIGILHDRHEDAYALEVLSRLRALKELCIGDNQPYEMDETDYTVPRHAYTRGLSYVELEVRQDNLSSAAKVESMANLLADVLSAALPVASS